tara:strand:- start:315 stop:647 length:333 start_codon:yes stop_codon:yes gene_type:complete
MTTVKETFKKNLKASNKSIQTSRANRIADVAKMEYDVLVNNKKREIFNIENDLESMADISTSNVTTSANAISGTSFDAKAFVTKRAELKDSLILCQEELQTLLDDSDFYA